MGNNLVARSSLPDLGEGLSALWRAVYLHGQLKPLALPLIGSGLARSYGASNEDLLATIIESFVLRSRELFICPELRIVIRPPSLQKVNMLKVARFVRKEMPEHYAEA
jgi:hypothetical protein